MVRAPNKLTCDVGRYIVSWVEQRTKKTKKKTKAKQTKNKYSYTTIDATAPSDMENLSLSAIVGG